MIRRLAGSYVRALLAEVTSWGEATQAAERAGPSLERHAALFRAKWHALNAILDQVK